MPRLASSILATALVLASVPAVSAAQPGYDLKPGQTEVYLITIEFSDGETIWKLEGTPNYTIVSRADGAAKIRFQGVLRQVDDEKRGGPPELPFVGFDIIGGGGRFGREPVEMTFSVNDRGEVLRTMGSTRLPFLMGELHELILVPLPEDETDHWTRTGTVEILVGQGVEKIDQYSRDPLRRILGKSGIGDPEPMPRLACVESVEYRMGEDGVCHLEYALTSREQSAGRPRVQLRTEGTARFSEDGFLPRRVEFSGKLVVRDGLTSVGREIQFSAKRLTEEDLARRAELARQEREEAKRKRAMARKKASQRRKQRQRELQQKQQELLADLDELIADLKSDNEYDVRQAALRLAGFTGEVPNRPEVAKALNEALAATEFPARRSIAQAIAKWATPKQSDLVLGLLDEENFWIRCAAIEAVGKRQFKKAIPELVALLDEGRYDNYALDALEQFGVAAEEALLKKLRTGDLEWPTNSRVIRVLAEIGTSKSLPTLKKRAASDDHHVKYAAQRAVESIEERME